MVSKRGREFLKQAIKSQEKKAEPQDIRIEPQEISKYPLIIDEETNILQKLYNNTYLSLIKPKFLESLTKEYYIKPNNMPYSVHFIWLTMKYDPKEMKIDLIDDFRKNIELLSASRVNWNFYLWVNNKSLTPGTVNFCQSYRNCYVKEISVLAEYSLFKDKVSTLINSALYSQAADVLRANILEENGGIYVDTDYTFKNSPHVLHNYFDFYAGFEREGWLSQIGSGFIAAKPHHPIISEYKKNIYQAYNIKQYEDVAYKITAPVDANKFVVLAGGPYSITAAYYLHNNQGNNRDIVFPAEMIHEPESFSLSLNLDNSKIFINKIGIQNYEGSWLSETENSYISSSEDTIFSAKDLNFCKQQQSNFKIANALQLVLKASSKLKCSDTDYIEFNTHRVWLTNPLNPKLLNKRVLELVKYSIDMIDKGVDEYTHYWWMLKKEHYTDEMKSIFSQSNIEMRTIDELYPFYPNLEKAVSNAAKLSYSLSVDIIKWVVIYHFGGDYYDVDYKVTSSKVLGDLHRCSSSFLSRFNLEDIQNGMLSSKKGHALAKVALESYIDLLANHNNKFGHCSKTDQIMLMNIYGHVKPFISNILSEKIDPSSVILLPSELIIDESKTCKTVQYGDITLTPLGFDYRFNTWTGSDATVNIKKMSEFENNHQSFLGTDLCGDQI